MREVGSIRRAARGSAGLAFVVGAALGAGSGPQTVAAQGTVLHAAAAGTSQPTEVAEDIRDIRGPKAIPGSWILVALLMGAMLVALGAYAVRHRRRRALQPRQLTLSEQALKRLEEARPLMLPATAREFGIAASEVVRSYIEERFDVIATQRTTEEFLQYLLQSSHDALARHRSLLEEFLQRCDFVKFAGTSLTVTDMESLFQSARSFVLETGEVPAA
jgi:hypothetical protein